MANYMISHLGPLLVSLVLSGTLYGCALVQTYVYYKLFPKDSWKFRILVASEMVLQTAHLAFLALGVWQTVMTGYAHHPQILRLSNTTGISVVFSGPIAFSTQAFFVFRLYTFSRKKNLPIFCSTLVVTQFVITLMVSIATVTAKGLSRSWQWFIVSGLLITICADTTIAVSMSYYLRVNKADFGRTSRVVDRMVLYIMATGIITSISALAAGVSFLITPTVYIWTGLFIMESGLYTNSLLAALNARARFSHELQHPESADGLEVSLSRLDIRQLPTYCSESQGEVR
ncbi:hypothetical protein EDC04DRAFT_876509 [Pisolithus marmoratus]|nr:hypothetical protein EDC04DRAFT_876509 [Pisolithus marmoratus]